MRQAAFSALLRELQPYPAIWTAALTHCGRPTGFFRRLAWIPVGCTLVDRLAGMPDDRIPGAGQTFEKEHEMVHIAFDMHEGALASVRQDPAAVTRELRLAAAIKWYEMHRVSQGRAAEIAGVSRAEFIDSLGRYGVSPFQETVEDIVEELGSRRHEQ